MDFPPINVSHEEIQLSVDEFSRLGFSADIRRMASTMGAVAEHSEIVTWDKDFGYIYRVDVVDFTEDDQQFRPSSDFERSRYKVITRVVISTKGGEKYSNSSAIVETTKV